ncbi:MAG: GNAT family N-acetyltransferase [Bacteroidetes bacterium]|jgi:ElaA protein|nr:GNAT family N-acetyltransferase [Bacteroidota bacterium]
MFDQKNRVWQCKSFSDLSALELHRLLSLRAAVFVVEQNCPYLDPDSKDEHAFHVMAWDGIEMVACARILPAGISYDEVSIGRVATSASVRGSGVGKMLMTKTMEFIQNLFGNVPVKISAQSYLQKYYEGYGFLRTEKKEYLEDDIPHLEMIYYSK